MQQLTRNQNIIRTGVIGILVNVLLAIFKLIIGLLSNSIAILLDAINNLSDALSSIIIIVGTKLALKPANKKHPLGYGRVEYLSAMLIAGIVLLAGATSLVEAVKKIINPVTTNYSTMTLTIIVVAIGAKLLLGIYTRKKGMETDSNSLIASGSDALFDSIVTLTTLIGAAVMLIWNVNIDGWLGAVISAVIIKAGFGMLSDTLNDILGKRVTSEMSESIKSEILAFEEVLGVYDLFLDSYGPQKLAGSVHVEIYDTLSARQISILTRSISAHIYVKFGIVLTCGIYAVETENKAIISLRDEISAYVIKQPGVLEFHGFYLDESREEIYFDIVLDFSVKNTETFLKELNDELKKMHKEYKYIIQTDLDYSD